MTEPRHGSTPGNAGWAGNEVHPYHSENAYPAPVQEIWPVAQQPADQQSVIQHRGHPIPPVYFDGGAGSYFGVSILGLVITVLSLGLLFPLAYVLRIRWRIEHTLIEGRRMRFTGTGLGLFGMWLKWWFFLIITLGFYMFWLRPRLERWTCEHTVLAPPIR